MGTGLWSQQGNWEQTRDESGAVLMGAFCLWGGGADMLWEGVEGQMLRLCEET